MFRNTGNTVDISFVLMEKCFEITEYQDIHIIPKASSIVNSLSIV